MTIKKNLFSASAKKYGEKYTDHLFEQYKLFVESADKNSDRRLNAHKYFSSINAAIITVIGLTLQFGSYDSRMWTRLVLAIAGVGAAGVYWTLIKSYKRLNTAKFNIIHRIEKKLPLALYSAEWDDLGKENDKNKHIPFSHIEIWIPVAFGAGYVILLFWCLNWFYYHL